MCPLTTCMFMTDMLLWNGDVSGERKYLVTSFKANK